MKIILFIIIVNIISAAQGKSQITFYEFEIPENTHCKIILYDQDSTKSFTLFDNILEKPQKLILYLQKEFYKEKYNYPDKIVLPFPILDSGMYYLHFQKNEQVDKQKIIFLK